MLTNIHNFLSLKDSVVNLQQIHFISRHFIYSSKYNYNVYTMQLTTVGEGEQGTKCTNNCLV